MVFVLFRLSKLFEVLLNNMFERWGLRQTKCQSSGTIGCGWPSIDDGLDARVEGICNLPKHEIFLFSQVPQNLFGQCWRNAVSGQAVGSVIAQAICLLYTSPSPRDS